MGRATRKPLSRSSSSLVGLSVLLLLVVPGVAAAADAEDGQSPWEFTFEPYLWVAGVSATVGSDDLSTGVGVGFVDLLEHLRGAAMGAVSVRYQRIGLYADGNWVRVGDSAGLPAFTGFTDLDVELDIAFGTAAAFYRFRPMEGLTLDPYIGARWWFAGGDLEANPGGPSLKPERAWADFVVGAGLDYEITDRWFVESAVDIGGGASKFTWQAYAGTGFNFKPWFALSLGWRYIGVDYDRDGFKFDSTLSGLLVGLKFRL